MPLREIESCQAVFRNSDGAGPRGDPVATAPGSDISAPPNGGGSDKKLLPMKAAGNHQMQNEPEIVFEPDANPFTQAAQLSNLATFHACDWWRRRAQQKRRRNLHAFERLSQNSLLERFDVDNDVRQFRH